MEMPQLGEQATGTHYASAGRGSEKASPAHLYYTSWRRLRAWQGQRVQGILIPTAMEKEG